MSLCGHLIQITNRANYPNHVCSRLVWQSSTKKAHKHACSFLVKLQTKQSRVAVIFAIWNQPAENLIKLGKPRPMKLFLFQLLLAFSNILHFCKTPFTSMSSLNWLKLQYDTVRWKINITTANSFIQLVLYWDYTSHILYKYKIPSSPYFRIINLAQ